MSSKSLQTDKPASGGLFYWLKATLPQITWGIAVVMLLGLAAVLIWGPEVALSETPPASSSSSVSPAAVDLPEFQGAPTLDAIVRNLYPHTILSTRPREKVETYQIGAGDSVFSIAQTYHLQPETVLWANYDTLNDNPDMISPGDTLNIPPVDGVYYQWQASDTVDGVAAKFGAQAIDVLSWPGNHLDMTNPQIAAGTYIMIPGGHREFRSWVVPTIPRGAAGVNTTIYGPGACDTSQGGLGGTGTFVWPVSSHAISGNDYWSGHLGIDAAAGMGSPVYASDSGVVVYAGVIGGGYGNMVMIDHGNGYQTLYAHLSSIAIRCGQSVAQGQVIAYAGSTGNSTGPHLHFEVRYMGGFINPHYVLQ